MAVNDVDPEPAEETTSLMKESSRSGSTSTPVPRVHRYPPHRGEAGRAGRGVPEQLRRMALMLIAPRRYGQPEDVAGAHLFLASDEADFISGVVLPVFGRQLGA